MIPVQHGRGGWVNSRSTLAKAMTMAIASVAVMLVMSGCSSKKPAPIGDENPNANQLGENGTNGSNNSLEDWERDSSPAKAVRSATFISGTTITLSVTRTAPC